MKVDFLASRYYIAGLDFDLAKMSASETYATATMAKYATIYANEQRYNVISRWLPIPLAGIVAEYSQVDLHIICSIYHGVKFTATLTKDEATWKVDFSSEINSDFTTIGIENLEPDPQSFLLMVSKSNMCAFLLDGDNISFYASDRCRDPPWCKHITDVVDKARKPLYDHLASSKS